MPVSGLQSAETGVKAAVQTETTLARRGETSAQAIRQEMQKASDTETPLDRFRRVTQENAPLVQGEQELINNNIGTEVVDPTTGAKTRSAEELTRQTSATEQRVLVRDYLEKDFKDLTQDERDTLVGQVESLLTLDPLIEAGLPPRGTAQRKDAIESLLKEKGARTAIKAEFNRAFGEDQRLKDEVSTVKAQFEAAGTEEIRLRDEAGRNTRDLSSTDAALDRFKPGATDALELARLNNQYSKMEGDLGEKQELIDNLGTRILNQQNLLDRATDPVRKKDIQDDIDAKVKERASLRRSAKNISDQMARRDALKAEKDHLEAEKRRLEEQAPRLAQQFQEATVKRLGLQATLDQAKAARSAKEQAFVDSVNNIVSRGMSKYIEGRLEQAETARVTLLEAEIAKTKDLVERLIKTEGAVRYKKGYDPARGGRLNAKYDGGSAYLKGDMHDLLTQDPQDPNKGPDLVARNWLRVSLQREVNAGRMTVDEMNKLYTEKTQNKDFMASMRPVVTEALVTARIKTGKLTADEASIVINSDWGAGLIERAKATNPGTADAIKALTADGTIKGNFIDQLKRKDKATILKLLLAIIVGVTVPAIAPVAAGLVRP